MTRQGIQLAYPFEEKRLAKWQPPFIIQPKYDGERCRAIPVNDSYLLVSSQNNPIYSVPHIVKDLDSLVCDLELDGELYCHGMKFEEIHSIVSRTVNLHPDHRRIKFHVFDYVGEATQMERLIKLDKLFTGPSHIRNVYYAPFFLAETFDEVMKHYDYLISVGYEGMIVRHYAASYVRKRSIWMMKFKPKKEDVYEIVDLVEETSIEGVPKKALGAFVVRGSDGTPFKVGTGFTRGHRRDLWKRGEVLKGKMVRVSYQHLTSRKKVPRFPVFVEVIDED